MHTTDHHPVQVSTACSPPCGHVHIVTVKRYGPLAIVWACVLSTEEPDAIVSYQIQQLFGRPHWGCMLQSPLYQLEHQLLARAAKRKEGTTTSWILTAVGLQGPDFRLGSKGSWNYNGHRMMSGSTNRNKTTTQTHAHKLICICLLSLHLVYSSYILWQCLLVVKAVWPQQVY